MSDITGFAGGLSEAISGYLGQANKSALDTKQQQDTANIEQQKEINVAKAKKDMEGTDQGDPILTPEMAEAAAPGAGQLVKQYNEKNPNNPLKMKDGMAWAKQLNDNLNPDNNASNKEQEKLQKDYADRRMKVLSNRSGGLGLQDAKVNQAIDLRNAINQYYDPKTDRYNIPPSMHEEIALGTARLLSPTGTVAEGLVDKLKQGTAREKLANAAIYMGLANPGDVGGPTQDVAKMFVDTIDRQGTTAEQLRNHYEGGIKQLADPRLTSERRKQVESADLTNSFTKELMKAPDYQKHTQATLATHPVGKIAVVNSKGQRGFIPAAQLDDALKNGYRQQ